MVGVRNRVPEWVLVWVRELVWGQRGARAEGIWLKFQPGMPRNRLALPWTGNCGRTKSKHHNNQIYGNNRRWFPLRLVQSKTKLGWPLLPGIDVPGHPFTPLVQSITTFQRFDDEMDTGEWGGG